jgi:hypothetical protein
MRDPPDINPEYCLIDNSLLVFYEVCYVQPSEERSSSSPMSATTEQEKKSDKLFPEDSSTKEPDEETKTTLETSTDADVTKSQVNNLNISSSLTPSEPGLHSIMASTPAPCGSAYTTLIN